MELRWADAGVFVTAAWSALAMFLVLNVLVMPCCIVKNDCLFVRGCWVFVGFGGGVLFCGFVCVRFVFFFRALVLVCGFCCLVWVVWLFLFCFLLLDKLGLD